MDNVKAFVIIKNGIVESAMEGAVDIGRLRAQYADCELCEVPRSVPLPVHGDRKDFYDSGWNRKSEVELIKTGLKPVPFAKKIAGDEIVDMTDDEKVIAGISPLREGMKIDGEKVVPMTPEERCAAGLISTDDFMAIKESEASDELNRRLSGLNSDELKLLAEINNDYALERKKKIVSLLAIKKQSGWPLTVEWPEE